VRPGSASPDFQLLFESAPGLYLVLTPELRIAAVSDNYLHATMTRRSEILGRPLFEVFPDNPDDPAATGVANLRASLERVIAHGRTDAMAVQKYDIRRPDHEGGGFEERFWSPVNIPVFGPSGELIFIIHRAEDVTEFLRLQRDTQQQQQLAEELRTRAGVMEIEIYRRAQELQDSNRRLRELQAELEARVASRTADLQATNDELQREMSERRRTEAALLRSEEQLRQAQKLEAVGRLAGGVAHDFNNLLTVILSYASLLLADMRASDPHRAEVEEILRAGQRAADLTRQLLAFSRQQILDRRVLDINHVVGELRIMLARVLGEDIELKTLFDSDLNYICADRGQIEQVIMNLVVNARDAMPDGGSLTIETANVNLSEAYAREHPGVVPGPYVMVAVSDTGAGMDKATQTRAFEPFFTTKERGKGTGLGLSTVFGIVRQSEGHIWLYSEPGSGTAFKLYFPRAEGLTDDSPEALAPTNFYGAETILLVEDEDQVRAVAAGVLRRYGYHVLEARSPGEALLTCEQHPVAIHLLLTDVVMPKLNGRLLAHRISHMRPNIRVVYMSGYTDNVITHHGVLDSDVAFVQKPLTPEPLVRKIREVLDAPFRPMSSRPPGSA
jgi:signal transduction histidine kinase/CheY-like chemotaxis protein